nr:MAG TPA: hypothetical protein [Caudoviricetes sp.]
MKQWKWREHVIVSTPQEIDRHARNNTPSATDGVLYYPDSSYAPWVDAQDVPCLYAVCIRDAGYKTELFCKGFQPT